MRMAQNPNAIKSDKKRIHFNFSHFTELLDIYLSSTHLHGCRYIVDKRYNALSLIYWITLLVLSFTFFVCLIFIQLNRYYDSPILNIITSTGYPVWKSPFPTVVVCNRNAVYRDNTGRITRILKENGVDDGSIDEFFNSLPNLITCDDCFENEIGFDLKNVSDMYNILANHGYDVPQLMIEVAHPCRSMLEKCKWQAEKISCVDIFRLIKTNLGYCCAFNYNATKEEQMENKEPYYIGGAGLGSGLGLTINIEPSQYISSFNGTPGVTVFTHNGLKYPQVGVKYSTINVGDITSFELELDVFKSDTDIERLSPNTRDCLFETEGNLKWTNIYSSHTCFNECKANYIEKLCGCMPFYYPNIGGARVCDFSDIPCLFHNKTKFTNLMLSDDIPADTEYMLARGIKDPEFCYCLPNCNEVSYTFREKKRYVKSSNQTCVLNVYYNNVGGILRIRTAILTWDTLLGTIGGTFGLCMGGSVISVLEFLFYLMQVICGKRFFEKRRKPAVNSDNLKINVMPKINTWHM